MLIILLACRVIINIIIIDVCILGDCTAWRKLSCCCRRRRRRFGVFGDSSSSSNTNSNNNNNNNNDNVNGDDDGWIAAFRRAGIEFMGDSRMDPVSYLYSRPERQRNAFLESIIDSKLLTPYNVMKVQKEKDKDNDINSVEKEASLSLCSICLQDQEPGEQCCRAKACSHTFHTNCIKSWIERSLLCPVCRKQMISNDELLDCMSKKRNLFVISGSDTNETSGTTGNSNAAIDIAV